MATVSNIPQMGNLAKHRRTRITRKIDQAIEAIVAAENPNFMEKIKREAIDRTLKSLGIAELRNEVENILTLGFWQIPCQGAH